MILTRFFTGRKSAIFNPVVPYIKKKKKSNIKIEQVC